MARSLTSRLRAQGKTPTQARETAADMGRTAHGTRGIARMAARKRGAKRAART